MARATFFAVTVNDVTYRDLVIGSGPGFGNGDQCLVAFWKRPSPTLTSIFQYFTAGVILAASVAELIPDLDIENHLWPVAIGFSIGIVRT